MLLFYEDEPSSIGVEREYQPKDSVHTIAALPEYGCYAFLRYHAEPQPIPSVPSSLDPSSNTIPPDPLKVNNTSTWSYCGPLLHPNSPLPPSFDAWSKVTFSDPALLTSRLIPLLRYLGFFLPETGAHHYWITLRATKPTAEYNTPRWHTDAHFFAPPPSNTSPLQSAYEEEDAQTDALGFRSTSPMRDWKLCTVLLGPPTLFLADNDAALVTLRGAKSREREKAGEHTCTSIRCVGCSTYADSLRSTLATSLACAETVSPAPNEIAFFRLGDREGAVHSEPRCDEDRVFVNIVPGRREDLEGLLGRWGMRFPRAWCFGLDGSGVRSDEWESWEENGDGEAM